MPDSTVLYIDGYNDSLRVGYEYIADKDRDDFTYDVVDALADSTEADGPYIKTVNEVIDHSSSQDHLELTVESFIDTLKAHGVI